MTAPLSEDDEFISSLRRIVDTESMVAPSVLRMVTNRLEQRSKALRDATAENICDACVGTGEPISGLPCMCEGTGKMSDAARYLRQRVVELESRVSELEDSYRLAIYDNDVFTSYGRNTEASRLAAEIRARRGEDWTGANLECYPAGKGHEL